MKLILVVCVLCVVFFSAVTIANFEVIAKSKVAPTTVKKIAHKSPQMECGVVYGVDNNAVTTTVSKYVAQSGLQFYPMVMTITGTQAPYAELTVTSGSTQTMSDGIGNVTAAHLQMLYIATDSLDVTLSCGTSTVFGTSAGTLSIQQGTPFEWDTSCGNLGFTDWQSLSITAGTGGTLSGGTAASTAVHIRSSLSQ